MKKVVMIISQENFQDTEFTIPKKKLEENGVEVTVASSDLNEATGMYGQKVKPDVAISVINARDYDVVIFVGGMGASQYWDDPAAHQLAQDAVNHDKILAAICIAPVTLARAGVLKGKKATVFPSQAELIKAKGANYTARPVEKEGNIITAAGPFAAAEFADQIIMALSTR